LFVLPAPHVLASIFISLTALSLTTAPPPTQQQQQQLSTAKKGKAVEWFETFHLSFSLPHSLSLLLSPRSGVRAIGKVVFILVDGPKPPPPLAPTAEQQHHHHHQSSQNPAHFSSCLVGFIMPELGG